MNSLDLELRRLRSLMIAIHVKEKSHNENIKRNSMDVRELHKQRDRLMDLYIDLHLKKVRLK